MQWKGDFDEGERRPIRITIQLYPFRPPTIHQYSLEYNESTSNRKLSCHPKQSSFFQSSTIHSWRGNSPRNLLPIIPVTIQIHLSLDILACSGRRIVKSGSFES
ncbi:hypothetical protein QTG54_014360 [Skeletonema marinoi]|uniref:Uncharacterized protein n=1 Tax=Skeletonema marinoi TaxID=267567 RepID=A0AAD8XWW0_9STRA|nr:hypothetical protein QTG54_014358 [Skeletonema marinoi]KAK1734900.1 hypothetical protein QTG54_014360 [Skeletonema marinoi]